MTILESLILGVVQGLTEFLPISSSGHLALLQILFGFKEAPIFFDTLVHFATLLAIVFYFRKDIFLILKNIKERKTLKFVTFLGIATIPSVFLGFLLERRIATIFSSLFLIAFCFLINSFILFFTKFFKEKKEDLNYLDSLIIGIFQAFSIFPGISRSGSTISAGIYRGVKKEIIFKFSFLLSIPLILGAMVLQIFNLELNLGFSDFKIYLIGFLSAFGVGFFTLKILEKIIIQTKLHIFAFYSLILSLILIFLL